MKRKRTGRASSAPRRRLAGMVLCVLAAMVALVWAGWYSPWATEDQSVRVTAVDAPPEAPPAPAPAQAALPAAAPGQSAAPADDAAAAGDRPEGAWRAPQGPWVPPVQPEPDTRPGTASPPDRP